ncbi:unnamed protein product [Calypogeia fissa]
MPFLSTCAHFWKGSTHALKLKCNSLCLGGSACIVVLCKFFEAGLESRRGSNPKVSWCFKRIFSPPLEATTLVGLGIPEGLGIPTALGVPTALGAPAGLGIPTDVGVLTCLGIPAGLGVPG